MIRRQRSYERVVHSLERSQKYIRIRPVFLERFQNYILKILQTTVTLVLCLHCKGFFKLSQNMEGNIVQTKEYINRVYHALSFKVRYWILPMLHYFLLIVILKLWKQTHGNGCTPQFLTRHRSINQRDNRSLIFLGIHQRDITFICLRVNNYTVINQSFIFIKDTYQMYMRETNWGIRCITHNVGLNPSQINEHTLIFYSCESNQRFLTSSCFLSVFISVACASILASILPLSWARDEPEKQYIILVS